MRLSVAAVGALVAALLETSVLPELAVADVKPDLVFAITIVVAMAVGFEDALVWAVVGGLLVDAMSGRPLGTTTLALLLVTGLAMLAGRLTGSPRIITVAAVVFALSFVYQILILAILAVAAGVGVGELSGQRFLAIAILDTIIAVLAMLVIRALSRRFGPTERPEW